MYITVSIINSEWPLNSNILMIPEREKSLCKVPVRSSCNKIREKKSENYKTSINTTISVGQRKYKAEQSTLSIAISNNVYVFVLRRVSIAKA